MIEVLAQATEQVSRKPPAQLFEWYYSEAIQGEP